MKKLNPYNGCYARSFGPSGKMYDKEDNAWSAALIIEIYDALRNRLRRIFNTLHEDNNL